MARAWRRAALLGCALCCAASCRQILGIEDAEIDPTLDKALSGQGGGAGAGGEPPALPGGAPAGGSSGAGGDSALAGQPSEAGRAGETGRAGEGGQAGEAGQLPTGSVCERYCSTVMSNCTGTFAVFTSREACLAVCAYLPEGQEGDRDVNTAHCRLRAATIAKDEIPHYCPIAGPGGNDGCGSNCESLCTLRAGVCADFITGTSQACSKDCAALNDLGTFSTDLGEGQYQGPHVQCRLYHVSAAAVDDPEQHCLHVDGAAPCQ